MKLKVGGIPEMLYFKNKYKEREKKIMTTPVSPNVAKISPTNLKAAQRHPVSQSFVIDDILVHSADVKTYILRRKDGERAAYFRAGQYVVIREMVDGKLIARPISLSCSPSLTAKGCCSITVKRVPDAFLSGHILDTWEKGREVTTSGPQGVFYYEPFRDARKVMGVCGGSGVTPFVSMAEAIADGIEDFELTILYGSKKEDEILFRDRFDAVMKKTDKVKVVYVLSDEEKDGYEHGFIGAELIKKYAGNGVYSIFAAGPMAMYRFLDGEVEKLGLIKKYYRKEIFGASKQPWTLPGYPQECKDKTYHIRVTICDKQYELDCAANETILVAFERAGIAGPNRCRGGICGWCRSKLLSGDVYIPEDTDGRREADKLNGYIHPCASFPLSDLVIEVPFNK